MTVKWHEMSCRQTNGTLKPNILETQTHKITQGYGALQSPKSLSQKYRPDIEELRVKITVVQIQDERPVML